MDGAGRARPARAVGAPARRAKIENLKATIPAMKYPNINWLLPLALLVSQPALADYTAVFYDPCDNCTYPDGGEPRPPGYPAENPAGYTPAQGQYYGADGGPGGDIVGTEEAFDVLSMTVTWSGANLVVTVLTRFTEGQWIYDSNTGEYAQSKIVFGDLIIATGAPGDTWKPDGTAPYEEDDASSSLTQWNYVLDTQTGDLYQGTTAMLMNTNDPGADAYYDGLFRANQYMQWNGGGTLVANLGLGTGQGVDIQDADMPDPFVGNGTFTGTSLTYTIPLAALNISLNNPAEVALRWTMTCANDIVEAAVTVGQSVPEPASLALFLGGLAGLRLMRRPRA